jgi:hypothetical protein
MTIDETTRHRLHQSLDRTLGEDNAAVLMEHLPPSGWSDLPTRRDLDTLRTDLNSQMVGLRADLNGQMSELRTDLNGQMADLRTEMAELRTEMYRLFTRLMLQLVGAIAGLLTVFFVLARLTLSQARRRFPSR